LLNIEGAPKNVPFFNKLKGEQMTTDNTWLKTEEEKIRSLIADEAKMIPMLDNMQATIRQLKAKQAFRLAQIEVNKLKEITNETFTTHSTTKTN